VRHRTDRGEDRAKRCIALSLDWSCLVAVAVPALVYIGVIIAHYDGRPYLQGDCQYYFYTAVSLFEDHDVDLMNNLPAPLSRHSEDVSLDLKGRLVPKHPIWMAVFALPFVVAFGAPGALFFNLVQLVLLIFLVFRFTRRFASPWASALATAATGVLSILPHYVWNFSPDVFSCLLLVAGLTALPADRSPGRLRHCVAGILFGLAAVSKFSLFLALPGLPLLCGRSFRKSIPALAFGIAVPMVFWSAFNLHLFGSPLTTSYDRIARIEGDVVSVHSQRSDFGLPLLVGARAQVMDRAHGLLFTSPVTLLSLVGLFPLARKDRGAALYLLVTFLSVFLFFSTYQWWAASHHGNRFLIPIIVLASVPLASLIDWFAAGYRSLAMGRRS